MSVKDEIIKLFSSGNAARKTAQELCKQLHIPYREKYRVESVLLSLCKSGDLFVDEQGRYGTKEQLGLIAGTICGNERGFAFLIPDDKERYPDDFFIPKKYLHGALHGDKVLCCKTHRSGESDEVSVVTITERGKQTIVGTFERDKHAGYLIPDEKRYATDIFIPLNKCSHIKNGVKAVAQITDYPKGKMPGGEIIEVLGDEDDFYAEELSIIRSYDLNEVFPESILDAANEQEARGISPADLVGRTDFRAQSVITIDGEDTRDIDDAVFMQKEGEYYRLFVHIADVSHYVKARSPLDKEAFERGTSVYFPDRVLPMLPKALSNGICSLNEGEDRLTLSCAMTVDKHGKVIKSEIANGVIRSRYKMTYTQVMQILDGDEAVRAQFCEVVEMIEGFAELTRILQAERASRGSVALDVKEAKIMLSEQGEIIIPDNPHMFSHEIIESFMVLANETVASFIQSKKLPFVYRIHEKPSEEKANAFQTFAHSLGLRAKFNVQNVRPSDYAKLLASAESLPAYSIINRVMLRSMQKARYSPENVGHFGLASECYCHFTSPIRRYPDLCVHRIVKAVLAGDSEIKERFAPFVEQAADQSSARERRAADAERDVDDLYKAMYMSERLKREYDAVISGVSSHGLYAELANTIEGFIPVETLYGSFQFDEARLRLVGKEQSFAIGERVRIKVVDVDFYRRKTLFRLLKKIEKDEKI